MSNQNMKLQLIIEALNRTDQAWTQLRRDTAAAVGDTNALTTAGAKAGRTLNQAGKDSAGGFNQASASIGSVYNMLMMIAGGAIARKLATMGYEFNNSMEVSRLGIAAIVTSMATVTNSQGKILQGQEKFIAAQEVSADAQRELLRMAMETPATFQELVQAYQGILAPALSAKMTFQETLEYTSLMTNAVKAIGLPLQQIVQEARDLASGTIDQNSQLARSLQITNEEVKAWREKGIVFQEVKKRMEGFVFASKEYAKTLDGAISNFKDLAQRALGDGAKPFFEFIKGEINKLTADIANVTKNAKGEISYEIKPEVIARIRELAEDLRKLVVMMEAAVKLGVRFAEPIMWASIAFGIGKISLAIAEMYTAIKVGEAATKGGTLAKLIANPQLALAIATLIAGAYIGKTAADNIGTSTEAASIRQQVSSGHDAKRIAATNPDYFNQMNLDRFQGPQLNEVRKRLPAITDAEIVKLIRDKVITLKTPGVEDRYMAPKDFVNIDVTRAEKSLDALRNPKSGINITGNNKPTAAEIKKINDAALAAADLAYQQKVGQIDLSRERDLEAVKESLRQRKLLHEQGSISEADWITAQEEAKQQEIDLDRFALTEKMKALNSEWTAKENHYTTAAALDKAFMKYSQDYDKLDLELTKESNKSKAALDDAEIARAKLKQQTLAQIYKAAEIERAGQEKRLADSLKAQDELNRWLVERGDMTDREALKARLAGEEALLELRLKNAQLNFAQAKTPVDNQKHVDDYLRAEEELQALQARKNRELIDDDSFSSGVVQGFREFKKEAEDTFNIGRDMAQQTANAMTQSFSDYFFDVMEGKFNTLGDAFKSLLKSMQRMLADFFAQQATNSLLKIGGDLLGGLVSPTSSMYTGGGAAAQPGGMNFVGPMQYHSGGFIVPRFHFGGLASDEVPAILQTGEGVLSRKGMTALDALNKGGALGGGNTFPIHVEITLEGTKKMASEMRREMEEAAERVIKRHS